MTAADNSYTFAHDGLSVRVYPADDAKPTVLFLNGIFGGAWIWEPVVEGLTADGYGVVTFEEPLAAHVHADDLQALTSSILLLCDLLPDSAPVLCGNSLGGLVTMELAAAQPDRWPGLVLAGPGGLGEPAHTEGLGSIMRTPNLKLGYALANRIFHRKELITPELIDKCTEDLSTRMLIRAGRALRNTRDYDARPLLPQISAPTLLLCGQYDEVSPAGEWRKACDTLPFGEFIEIPDSGHSPMVEEPEIFVGALLSWLARQPVHQ